MENPDYFGARGALLAAGARLVPVPVDEQGLMVEIGRERCESARLVSTTPSHQFPTGVTMSLSRRMILLDWARQAGAWILEDDYDSEYRFSGRPLEALQGLDRDERVLYIGTFSKVLFPALRLILAITAGLFEEVGRYVGYRLFLRREPKTWSKAVMFGLGHGGLESMVVVGGQIVLNAINTLMLLTINVNTLPVAQRQNIIHLFADINTEPFWLPLLSAWERLWTLPLHVALAVIVLQVFRRQQMVWLFLAILFHALVDFVAGAIPQALGHSLMITLLVEGVVCVFGLISVWIIWRLREPEEQAKTEVALTRL